MVEKKAPRPSKPPPSSATPSSGVGGGAIAPSKSSSSANHSSSDSSSVLSKASGGTKKINNIARSKKNFDPEDDDTNIHRLVQDENAKTILLNFPLEVAVTESSSSSTATTTTTTASMSTSAITSNPTGKPPKRPQASPRPPSSSQNNEEAFRRSLRGASADPGDLKKSARSTKANGGSTSSTRVRSASVGRDKKSDLQARYWAFLFENLRRAVDDLYRTCESDENIPAAKEVILVFENYVRDFRNLADWLRLKFEYENTPPPKRPTSLAWEVRKTPPASNLYGKLTPTTALVTQRLLMAAPARRALDFDQQPPDHHDVSEAIKEVEVTPVEDIKETNTTAPPTRAKSPAATASSSAAKTATTTTTASTASSATTSTRGYSVVTKAVAQKQTRPGSAINAASSSSNNASSGKRASAATLSTSTSSTTAGSATSSRPSRSSTSATASIQSTTTGSSSASTNKAEQQPASKSVSISKSSSNNKDGVMVKSTSSDSSGQSSASSTTVKSTSVNSSSSSSAKKTSTGERVSLVARQARFAASNSNSRNLVRSVTTPSLPGRGGLKNTNANKTQTGGPTSSAPSSAGTSRGRQPLASSRSGPPSTPTSSSINGNGNTVPPFGSTSSISSSSSNRSWADTVKGLKAPRSVENLTSAVASDETNKQNNINPDDEGWEMVKPRTRSKFSPLSTSITSNSSVRRSRNLVSSETSSSTGTIKRKVTKQDSHDSALKDKVKHSAKARFQVPTSANSLPSLATSADQKKSDQDGASDKPTATSKKPSTTTSTLRGTKSASSLVKRDRQKTPNLERVAETTGSNASSSENLSDKDNKENAANKQNSSSTKSVPIKSATKRESLTSKKSVRPTIDSKQLKAKKEPPVVVSPSSPVVADLGGDSDNSDEAVIDKKIAQAEKEEKDLEKEIADVKNSEMPSEDNDDGDSSDFGGLLEDKASGGEAPLTPSKYSAMFESLSWADQMDLEDQLLESRYPGRAIQLHEKLSSPARKREPQEAFKHHQKKQENAKIRREMFQEEKANKLSALNARIEEVIAQKEAMINERKELIENKMAKAEAKRQEYIDSIKKKAREEEAKLKEIAFINNLNEQNARIDMLAQNQTTDEKVEERLAEIAEERANRIAEREAKEARAEERRRVMEERRQKNVEALRLRIRTREERIQEEQEQKEKDRLEAAKEKARDREEKLSTVRAAEKDMKEKRQEKMLQKQEDAAKRHKEKLASIRNKAFELSVQRCSTDESASSSSVPPMLQPYEPRKKCDICDVIITNEVRLHSHLRGRKHKERVLQANNGRKLSGEEIQNCNLKYIVDASADEQDPKIAQSRERSRAMKKRAKKIKTRMSSRAAEFEAASAKATTGSNNGKTGVLLDAPNKAKIGKSIRDIEKLLSSQGKGCWPDSSVSLLERALGEVSRCFDKKHPQDKAAFFAMNGFTTVAKLFGLLADQKQSCVIPLKSIVSTANVFAGACINHRANTEFVLKSNHLTTVVDILLDRLRVLVPDLSDAAKEEEIMELLIDSNGSGPRVDPVAKAIMTLVAQVLEHLNLYLLEDKRPMDQSKPGDLNVRAQDQVSYIVAIGIVDKVSAYCHSIRDPIDSKPDVGDFLLSSLQLLSSLTGVVEALSSNTKSAVEDDPTHLWKAFEVTDLAGTVELLYGMLLHQGAPARSSETPAPPKLPTTTVNVVAASADLLHRMVRQRLKMVQDVLSQEGISLEFRHIVSYLLWYCQQHQKADETKDLMHEVIILVGYFAARHVDNQLIVQSGHQPSVLQQLCNLPFPYFSQPKLKAVLFPTLLACCHENKENTGILSQEMSWTLIDEYLKTPDGKGNNLVQLVIGTN